MTTLTDREITERVVQCITEIYGVQPQDVTPQMRLTEDIGGDSLDTVELVLRVEEEFGITIPEEQAANIRQVLNVIAIVKWVLNNPNGEYLY